MLKDSFLTNPEETISLLATMVFVVGAITLVIAIIALIQHRRHHGRRHRPTREHRS